MGSESNMHWIQDGQGDYKVAARYRQRPKRKRNDIELSEKTAWPEESDESDILY